MFQKVWLPGLGGIVGVSERRSGNQGRVHFKAYYRSGEQWRFLEERSVFVRESGRWLYVNGKTRDESVKPGRGRNDSCLCGSGRKFKRCCG